MARNDAAELLTAGAVILFAIMTQISSVSSYVQVPISVVSAAWVTSDASYETGRSWTEIDAASGDSNMRLRITIQNLSNATISGISAELRLTYPFTNDTGGHAVRTYYSGSMTPGTSSTMDFLINIDLNATAGEYRLAMVLNYLELATGVGKTLYFMKSVEVAVPVVVSSTRYMVIYGVVMSPSTTVPAGNLTISGNLLNVGKISAYNTNVTVWSPALTRPASIIVGQVDPNVPRPFSSGLQRRRDLKPGTHTITVSVSYADLMAVGHISRADLKVTVRPSEPRPPPVAEKQNGLLVMIVQLLRDLLRVFFGLAEVPSILQ